MKESREQTKKRVAELNEPATETDDGSTDSTSSDEDDTIYRAPEPGESTCLYLDPDEDTPSDIDEDTHSDVNTRVVQIYGRWYHLPKDDSQSESSEFDHNTEEENERDDSCGLHSDMRRITGTDVVQSDVRKSRQRSDERFERRQKRLVKKRPKQTTAPRERLSEGGDPPRSNGIFQIDSGWRPPEAEKPDPFEIARREVLEERDELNDSNQRVSALHRFSSQFFGCAEYVPDAQPLEMKATLVIDVPKNQDVPKASHRGLILKAHPMIKPMLFTQKIDVGEIAFFPAELLRTEQQAVIVMVSRYR